VGVLTWLLFLFFDLLHGSSVAGCAATQDAQEGRFTNSEAIHFATCAHSALATSNWVVGAFTSDVERDGERYDEEADAQKGE
jgi:hypothetical protein